MSGTHHISRLRYSVSCPDEAQAFALRHLLSATTTEELIHVMQAVCDRCVPENEFLRIPRLEINLETGSVHGLSEALGARFGASLEAEIRSRRHEVWQSTESVSESRHHEAEALFFYLSTGRIPHWAEILEERLDTIAEKTLREWPAAVQEFLLANARRQQVWERISKQFSHAVQQLVIGLLPTLASAQDRLLKWFSTKNTDSPEVQPQIVATFRRTVAAYIVKNGGRILDGQLSDAALREEIRAQLETQHDLPPTAYSSTPDTASVPDFSLPELPSSPPPATSPIVIPLYPEPDAAEPDPGEKLRSATAGLILLHPYLPRFFESVGLMQHRLWIDAASQERAVHLLHYLATNLQREGEWNLLLEKILCGLDPAFPIERNVALSDAEFAECEALLLAVIGHWSALKKTSPRALQETFLCRNGLLSKTEQGWLLQVECKTCDVLLEALPWGISLIRLPWNDLMIEVIWK